MMAPYFSNEELRLDRVRPWLTLEQSEYLVEADSFGDHELVRVLTKLMEDGICLLRLAGFGKGPGELGLLKEVFLRTERYWEEAYHEPYSLDGTLARDAVLTDCWGTTARTAAGTPAPTRTDAPRPGPHHRGPARARPRAGPRPLARGLRGAGALSPFDNEH